MNRGARQFKIWHYVDTSRRTEILSLILLGFIILGSAASSIEGNMVVTDHSEGEYISSSDMVYQKLIPENATWVNFTLYSLDDVDIFSDKPIRLIINRLGDLEGIDMPTISYIGYTEYDNTTEAHPFLYGEYQISIFSNHNEEFFIIFYVTVPTFYWWERTTKKYVISLDWDSFFQRSLLGVIVIVGQFLFLHGLRLKLIKEEEEDG